MSCKKTRPSRSLVFITAILILTANCWAQSSDEVATGLTKPNLKQLAEMTQTMVDSAAVMPNKLALDRLNAERLINRIPTTFDLPAPMGSEVVPSNSAKAISSSTPSSASAIQSNKSPGRVDNSVLPSFPPIRNQGNIGSCAAFSSAYYVGTHMLGLVRGTNSKKDTDNSNKLSPKFSYNLVNSGKDEGSWPSDVLKNMTQFGVPSWAKWPYAGIKEIPSNYLEWPRNEDVWIDAVNNRFDKTGRLGYIHSPDGLKKTKEMLANGYVLAFSTDVIGWQYDKIKDDPSTKLDDGEVGKNVCWMVTQENSGHVMTIVGYDDNLWIDINRNGKVDQGEKGAFKIANSWGTGWCNSGFAWMAYDALQLQSTVKGVDNSKRTRPKKGEWWLYPIWGNEVYWISAQPNYSPKLLARVKLNHVSRNQLRVRLARSKPGVRAPTTYSKYLDFNALGGSYAFDGGSKTIDGTFVFDLSDLYLKDPQRYFVSIGDSARGASAQIKDYSLTSPGGVSLATASVGIPSTIDNRETNFFVEFGGSNVPQLNAPSSVNVRGGQSLSLPVATNKAPATYSASGLPPGLYISDPSKGIISGVPTQSGTFTARVSAANGSGVSSNVITFDVKEPSVSVPRVVGAMQSMGTIGEDFHYQISATNNPNIFDASGLPDGLSCNKKTGLISGKPTQAGMTAAFISASNEAGTGSNSLTINVRNSSQPSPEIIGRTTFQGIAASVFTYRIESTNNPASFDAENLPPELEINRSTGVISGNLRPSQTYSIRISAKNEYGSDSKTLFLSTSDKISSRPYNDDFTNAASLVGVKTMVCASNLNASMEINERPPANKGSNTVWWSWISPRNSKATLSTSGSNFDTVLSVYSGDQLINLQLIAENDNASDGVIKTSQTEFMAEAGKTYRIAVGGAGNQSGSILLGLQQESAPPPSNDNFKNATLLTGTTVQTIGTNIDATSEKNEVQHLDQPASKSVWWSWTAPDNGYVKLDTAGSTFNSLVAVYQNLIRASGQEIQLKGNADFIYSPEDNNDSIQLLAKVAEDAQNGEKESSKASFTVVAGTTYYFAVDGRYGSGGVIKLQLHFSKTQRPKNDDFLSAEHITGSSVRVAADSTSASTEPNEPRHNAQAPARSVWWYWTPDISGPARISTAGSNFDTILAIYSGSSLSNLRKLVSNDDSAGKPTSSVEIQANKGHVYYIAVDGHDISGGNIDLQISQTSSPLNDQFVHRAPLSGNHISVSASNEMATTQSGEPDHAGTATSKSLWWNWKADYSAPVRISTAGSDFDTVLAVYNGNEIDRLKPLVSNNNTQDDLTSTVWFEAKQGVTYQIAVAGQSNASGSVNLSIEQDDEGVVYQTDFNSFPIGNNALSGIDNWTDSDSKSGSSGIRVGADGSNLEGWLGFNKPSQHKVDLQRIVNAPKNSNIVEFGLDLNISDSSPSRSKDAFSLEINNIGNPGNPLGGIVFDNSNGKIYRFDGATQIDTGVIFRRDSQYTLDAVLHLKENNWSVYLNSEPIFENQPLTSTSLERSVGAINLAWSPSDPKNPGDNLMAFDNYYIATCQPPPTIQSPAEAYGIVGQDFTYKITSSDNPQKFEAYDLPRGLTCDPSTGVISGKPEKAGNSLVMITATKGVGVGSKMLAIKIN